MVKGFNPRPSVKTGELFAAARANGNNPFQSTPVSEDGRTAVSEANNFNLRSFNPRPSVKTGEHH